MIIVVMMVRVFAACVHRETACSLEIKTRSEDNCITEFTKAEFINVNDKKKLASACANNSLETFT